MDGQADNEEIIMSQKSYASHCHSLTRCPNKNISAYLKHRDEQILKEKRQEIVKAKQSYRKSNSSDLAKITKLRIARLSRETDDLQRKIETR